MVCVMFIVHVPRHWVYPDVGLPDAGWSARVLPGWRILSVSLASPHLSPSGVKQPERRGATSIMSARRAGAPGQNSLRSVLMLDEQQINDGFLIWARQANRSDSRSYREDFNAARPKRRGFYVPDSVEQDTSAFARTTVSPFCRLHGLPGPGRLSGRLSNHTSGRGASRPRRAD